MHVRLANADGRTEGESDLVPRVSLSCPHSERALWGLGVRDPGNEVEEKEEEEV